MVDVISGALIQAQLFDFLQKKVCFSSCFFFIVKVAGNSTQKQHHPKDLTTSHVRTHKTN